MGGSCAQVGKPGTRETGTPEGVPRTAAMTQDCSRKNVCSLDWALLRSGSTGFQARSLNGQRRAETIPSKKSVTRRQSAQIEDSEFAYKVLRRHPILRHLQ